MVDRVLQVKSPPQDRSFDALVTAYSGLVAQLSAIGNLKDDALIAKMSEIAAIDSDFALDGDARNRARTQVFEPLLTSLLGAVGVSGNLAVASLTRNIFLVKLVHAHVSSGTAPTVSQLIRAADILSLVDAVRTLDVARERGLDPNGTACEDLDRLGTLGYAPIVDRPISGQGATVAKSKLCATVHHEVVQLFRTLPSEVVIILKSAAGLFERRKKQLLGAGNPPGGDLSLTPRAYWTVVKEAKGVSEATAKLLADTAFKTSNFDDLVLVLDCIRNLVKRNLRRADVSFATLASQFPIRELDLAVLQEAFEHAVVGQAIDLWNSDGEVRNSGWNPTVLSRRALVNLCFRPDGLTVDENPSRRILRMGSQKVGPKPVGNGSIEPLPNYLPLGLGIVGNVFAREVDLRLAEMAEANPARRSATSVDTASTQSGATAKGTANRPDAESVPSPPAARLSADEARCAGLCGKAFTVKQGWTESGVTFNTGETITILGLSSIPPAKGLRVAAEKDTTFLKWKPDDLLRLVDRKSIVQLAGSGLSLDNIPEDRILTNEWARGILGPCTDVWYYVNATDKLRITSFDDRRVQVALMPSEKHGTRVSILVAFCIASGKWQLTRPT